MFGTRSFYSRLRLKLTHYLDGFFIINWKLIFIIRRLEITIKRNVYEEEAGRERRRRAQTLFAAPKGIKLNETHNCLDLCIKSRRKPEFKYCE